ncbi:AaceriAER302Cp [[Ashbya] aceris (nom. inval.)]|nr:AaceriAER302Cp [[Ashbya] aceris (nom. inval.)]
MLGRESRVVIRIFSRRIAQAPGNSPRVAENEHWLRSLEEHAPTERNLEAFAEDGICEQQIEVKTGPGGFKYHVESADTDSGYLNVRSPLENFVSSSYLGDGGRRVAMSNFVDVRIVRCQSGSGGSGAVSFFRDAGRAIGPPDGGDGGDGGSVYVQAVPGLTTLAKLKSTYEAQDGKNGAGVQLDGARGRDVLLQVPVGTVVKWCMDPKIIREYLAEKQAKGDTDIRSALQSATIKLPCLGRYAYDRQPRFIQLFRNSYEPGEGWLFKGKDEAYHREKDWWQALNKKVSQHDAELTEMELDQDTFPLFGLDLDKPMTTPLCLLRGGKGGLGNMHFLTRLIRNPRFAKRGRSGLEQFFMFELKTVGDLGLVGLPNAGKSTILNRISAARPRVGHWEFTTLAPTIGTVSLGIDKPTFTVVDIPGIIKGAAQDKGMGLEFIRHIERSKGWVFVISLEKKEPIEDLQTLIGELGGMEQVSSKKVLVVCNKADIDCDKPESKLKYEQIKNFCDENLWDCIPISALKSENIQLLLDRMAKCAGKY